jgi:hypothetical protein
LRIPAATTVVSRGFSQFFLENRDYTHIRPHLPPSRSLPIIFSLILLFASVLAASFDDRQINENFLPETLAQQNYRPDFSSERAPRINKPETI